CDDGADHSSVLLRPEDVHSEYHSDWHKGITDKRHSSLQTLSHCRPIRMRTFSEGAGAIDEESRPWRIRQRRRPALSATALSRCPTCSHLSNLPRFRRAQMKLCLAWGHSSATSISSGKQVADIAESIIY